MVFPLPTKDNEAVDVPVTLTTYPPAGAVWAFPAATVTTVFCVSVAPVMAFRAVIAAPKSAYVPAASPVTVTCALETTPTNIIKEILNDLMNAFLDFVLRVLELIHVSSKRFSIFINFS